MSWIAAREGKGSAGFPSEAFLSRDPKKVPRTAAQRARSGTYQGWRQSWNTRNLSLYLSRRLASPVHRCKFRAMRVTHLHSRAWSPLASPFSLPDEKNLPQFISPAIKVFKESEVLARKKRKRGRGRIDDKIEKDGENLRDTWNL